MADMFGMVQNWWDPEGQDDREAQARRDAVIESAKQDKALRRQQMAFGLPYTGMAPAMLAASNAAQDHFANLGNAASAVNSAISTEMQSRVAQEREARRMEHEKELMRMRMQADTSGAVIRALLND